MKYFTIQELSKSAKADSLGIDNTPPENVVKSLEALVYNILDPLREAWGAPLQVTSGYRCPAVNKAVGGSATSQHVLGEAADIRTIPFSRTNNKKLYELIKKLGLPVDQCIDENDYRWVHVSYGPRNRRMYFAIK